MFLTLGNLMLPITEANAPVIWNEHIMVPIIWEETIPCSGDHIVLEGHLHMISILTQDSNGIYHETLHSNPNELSGEVVSGPNIGVKYHGVGITQWRMRYSIFKEENEDYRLTWVNTYNMIGEGDSPNLKLKTITHITINANGELTAYVDDIHLICE